MSLSKSVRIGLVALMVVSMIAIAWSFFSRRRESTLLSEAKILPPEIVRRSTEFEYAEHKRGRTVFKIFAKTSTETVNNIHTLKDVSLAYYDETGKPSDVISGDRAIYQIDKKLIEFSGNTRTKLAGGVEVFSEDVHADLVRETVTINREFRFRMGGIRGTGRSLVYEIPQQEIYVKENMRVQIPNGSEEVEAEAPEAVYRLEAQLIQLRGGVLITGVQSRLSARQIDLFMTQEQRLEKILSSGKAELRSGALRSFFGDAINVFFRSNADQMDHFEVLGDASDVTSDRARYLHQGKNGISSLEADRIAVIPSPELVKNRLLLKTFTAEGKVLLVSPALGISEARSRRLEGVFSQDGDSLKELDFIGQVSVKRQGRPNVGEEFLESEALNVTLGAGEVLEHAIAHKNVDLRILLKTGQQRLVASDSVEVSYIRGVPQWIKGRGDCRLENRQTDARTVLQAPTINVHYRGGLLESVQAEGGVSLRSIESTSVRNSTSERLTVFYQDGEIQEVVQSGKFRLLDEGPTTIEVTSEKGTFHPLTGRITMTGREAAVLKLKDEKSPTTTSGAETVASRFEFDRETGQMAAFGSVRSLIPEGDTFLIITSDRMKTDPKSGWVRYVGKPRIVKDANSITGEVVRYNSRTRQLVVEDRVEGLLIQGDEKFDKRYTVRADRLSYESGTNRARYEHDVRIQSENLVVNAPFVEFIFSETDAEQFKSIVAWGGVHLVGKSRQAKGDRAVHYPSEGKVVVTGEPAEVFEEKGGKAAGGQLTFYLGDERLIVENPPVSEQP